VPAADLVRTTSTTIENGPSPTPTMTNQDQGEAAVEGEVASRREPPQPKDRLGDKRGGVNESR
jgi:hypothetical protein